MATVSKRIEFDEVVSPRLVKLMRVWKEWSGDNRMPKADEIYLPRLKDIAPRLWIWDCTETNPERYRLLVYGSRIMLAGCRDLTGMRMSQMPWPDDYRAFVMRDYSSVVQSCKPIASRVVMTLNGRPHPYERVIFPVGQSIVTHLMVCSELSRRQRISMTEDMLVLMKQRKLQEQHTYSQGSIRALRSA